MTNSESAVLSAEQAFRRGASREAVKLLVDHRHQRDCHIRLREWACASRRLDLLDLLDQAPLPADDPEAWVDKSVRALLRGDPRTALSLLQSPHLIGKQVASIHHHAARALQNMDERARALEQIDRAVALQPDYAEAFYSRAHILRSLGQMQQAIGSYRQTLELMPGFEPALLNLGITLSAIDRPEEALAVLERLVQREPANIDARINIGLCLHALGRWEEALQSYSTVLRIAPGHPLAHLYMGCLYNEQKQAEPARRHLEAALEADPDNADAHAELIGLFEQANDLESARRHLGSALARTPSHQGLLLEAMRLARRDGDLPLAWQHAQALDPSRMSLRAAQSYWFERGVLCDRLGDCESAMAAFLHGNSLAAQSPRRRSIRREAFGQRIAQIRLWVQNGAEGASPQLDDPRPPETCRKAFLVGFPRSGTTLLDTMLDAHTGIVSIEERPTLELAIEQVLGVAGDYPAAMPGLRSSRLSQLRTCYEQQAARWLPEGFGGLCLDKLPLRLLRVPLLLRMFPEAPILFAVRHPCDVILSNFMQQYDPNEAFIHFDSLLDSANIYSQVMSVWRLIVETLPIKAHWIRYENLVMDPVTTLSEVCGSLGIVPEPAMLDTQARLHGRQQLRTNSYQQVAEPIYGRAVDRWRRYQQWLEPVLPILEPHIHWLGYEAR